jgi:HlyD family secretion protein
MTNVDSTSVLPGPLSDDDEPAGAAPRRRRLSGRAGVMVNLVIVAAVLLVLALIVWTVRGTGSDPTTIAQTSTVDTGEVTATVSANGNIASGTAVNVDFQGSGGVVTAILVEPGDKVRKGQVLARVDQTSARQSLEQARTQLASAQAAYDGAVQGQTPEERARDSRSVDQAEVSVSSARTSLRSGQQTLNLTRRQQNAAVNRADDSLADARVDLQAAREAYQADPTPENRQAVTTAQTAVDTAQSALITARATRDSALLAARQQVASARDQLATAQSSLASTKATVAVNKQAPRDSAVDSAQAQVDSAQVGVAQAQTTLDQTVLRAPVSGKVANLNGTVGEPSSSTSSSSSSASSTTGTSSGTSTTEATGFVTLTGTDSLQVTADVAEADIADVRVGQTATVTLSASGKEIAGTVTAVDSIETVTNNVVEYGVTVTLDETKGVKLGQSTQVVVTTGSKQGVVRVSASALTTVGDRTTATVQSTDGSTRTVEVVTGLEGDGYTQILSGLEAGDTVVLPEQADAPTGFTFPGGGGVVGLG